MATCRGNYAKCGDVHHLHHMYSRTGCSLPALAGIPLGPFLSASPSNLVRGPGAGAGPMAARWDKMGRDGMGGGCRGMESNWIKMGRKRRRRIHLESSSAMPRSATDSISGDWGQLGLGRYQSVLQSAMHLCCLDRRQQYECA